MVDDRLPITGAVITTAAAVTDKLQLWNGVGEVMLTWLGVLTGMLTLAWYTVKFVEYIRMKKEQRHAQLQRDLEK